MGRTHLSRVRLLCRECLEAGRESVLVYDLYCQWWECDDVEHAPITGEFLYYLVTERSAPPT